MYMAPDLLNSEYHAVDLRLMLSANDTTFYLPLTHDHADARIFSISLTGEERSRAEALALINRRYCWRGYGADHQLAGHDETIFTARVNGKMIGTVTLGTDSPSGLAVDQTFPEEMQFLRRKPNARLCELKKLAMEHGAAAKPVLAAMFHVVFIYGTHNCLGTELVIEVNPRHAGFYEKMLRFRRFGAIRMNKSVDAPSQLMYLSVSDIDSAIYNDKNNKGCKSLYEYFYDRTIEDRVIDRLSECALSEISGHFAY